MAESKERTTLVSRAETARLNRHTDFARLDALTDEDIARAVAEDPDAAPLDTDWTQARLVQPPGKDVVTLRIDRDVLEFFRAQGPGYRTRINLVLRAWREAHERETKKPAPAKPKPAAKRQATKKAHAATPAKKRA